MSRVAFIGTGLIGAGMVELLLRKGAEVTVFNRTREKAEALAKLGAVVASSPEEAARGASRVHFALSADDAVDATLDAIAPVLEDDTLVIDHSTVSPAGVVARVARHPRVAFVHAPVFMGPQGARDGAGIILVSGAPARTARAIPVLETQTGKVLSLGERPDLAASFKLFGNAMIMTLTGGLADVFSMARARDISPADAVTLFESFNLGGVITGRGKRMALDDFEPTFHLTMARKDVGLMLDVLAATGEPPAVLGGIAARMDARIAEGRGSDDAGVITAAPRAR